MTLPLMFLADSQISDLTPTKSELAASPATEWLIWLGALFMVIFLASLIVVVFSQKKKRRIRRHHSHQHSSDKIDAGESAADEPAGEPSGSRRRKRRRPHRPLNPTLAQTGGLPPIRDENTPLPPMP